MLLSGNLKSCCRTLDSTKVITRHEETAVSNRENSGCLRVLQVLAPFCRTALKVAERTTCPLDRECEDQGADETSHVIGLCCRHCHAVLCHK